MIKLLILISVISLTAFTQSKSEYDYPDEKKEDEKKDSSITDTKKKLNIKKGDIADPHKKLKISKKDLTDTTKLLEIRTGDLMDTKAMLRKTDFPNPEQTLMLKRIMAAKLGGVGNYRIAARKSPGHINAGLKSIWQIYRIDQDIKEVEQDLSVDKITDGRKKFLNDKKRDLHKNKEAHQKNVEKVEKYLDKLIKSEAIAGTGEFFDNVVTDEVVDLIDKLGEAKVRLKKGAKVKTKVHPKDQTFYLIEHDGETLFARREHFKLK